MMLSENRSNWQRYSVH